jgi:hypothetical protein
MKNTKSPEKRFAEALLQLARTQSLATVFDDFLDFALLFIRWWDRKPEDYRELEKRYPGKGNSELFAQAYLCMHEISKSGNRSLQDPFGDFYMEHLSSARTGQFFTPYEVCKLTAEVTLGTDSPDDCNIVDPCCGSGRLIMAAADVNPRAAYFAADVDLTCSKMTVLNFLLKDITGEVAWMDTLGMKHWRGWRISPIPVAYGHYLPGYTVLTTEEALFPKMWANTISHTEQMQETISPQNTPHKKRGKPPSPQLFIDFT